MSTYPSRLKQSRQLRYRQLGSRLRRRSKKREQSKIFGLHANLAGTPVKDSVITIGSTIRKNPSYTLQNSPANIYAAHHPTFLSSASEATLWPSRRNCKPRLAVSDTVATTGINANSSNNSQNKCQGRSGSRGLYISAKERFEYQKQKRLPVRRRYSALSADPAASLPPLNERQKQNKIQQHFPTTAAGSEWRKPPDPIIYSDVRINLKPEYVQKSNNANGNNGDIYRPGNRSELFKSTDSIGVCSRLLCDNEQSAQRRKSRIQGIAALGRDSQMYEWYLNRRQSFHTEAGSSIHVGEECGIYVESVFDCASDPVLTSTGSSSLRNTGNNTVNSAAMKLKSRYPAEMGMNTILDDQNELESSVLWMHGLESEHESRKLTGWRHSRGSEESAYPSSTAQQIYSPEKNASNLRDMHNQDLRCMFYSSGTGAVYAQSLHDLTKEDKRVDTLLESVLKAVRSNPNQRSSKEGSGFFWVDSSDIAEKEIRNLGDVFGLHPLTVQDMVQGCERDKIDRYPDYTFIAYHSVNGEGIRDKTATNQTMNQDPQLYYHRRRSCWDDSIGHGLRRNSSNLDNNCDGSVLATSSRKTQFSCAQLLDPTDNCCCCYSGDDDKRLKDKGSDVVYIVMRQGCVLTIHSGKGWPIVERVLQRLSALQEVVLETGEGGGCELEPLLKLAEFPPYVVYAVLDEMTSHLQSKIVEIERQVDDIDRLVLVLSHESHEQMLQQMGEQRRDILQIWQAVQAKPAVIMALAEQTEAVGSQYHQPAVAGEVAQYLGDIHNHLVAAIETCARTEAVLSRSHSNYLAKISLEMSKATYQSNATTERWTLLGVIVVPINIVTSLLGINLKVPGQDRDDTLNFFVLLACMLIYTTVMLAFWRWRQLA